MADRCDIVLESDTYTPGEVITGWVECTFKHEITVREIRVTFNGRVKVKWQEGKHSFKRDEKALFNVESNLLTCESTLQPGKYNYPFTFTLPFDIPSSMKEVYGNIKYTVRAVIDRPWAIDYESKKVFTVAAYNNLKLMDGLRQPMQYTERKLPLSIFGESRPITITVKLPKNGFAPNQMVDFTTSLKNESNIGVKRIRFIIIQGFEFYAHSKKRSYNSVSSEEFTIVGSNVAPGQEESWDLQLRIPENVFAATLNNCQLIKVFWTLRGVVSMPFPHKKFVINVPLILGRES